MPKPLRALRRVRDAGYWDTLTAPHSNPARAGGTLPEHLNLALAAASTRIGKHGGLLGTPLLHRQRPDVMRDEGMHGAFGNTPRAFAAKSGSRPTPMR
jgi:hypothetical protein